MKRTFKHLTFSNRLQIEAWLRAGIHKKEMALMLGVNLRTIYNELSRGQYEHLNSDYTTETRYSPDIAEEKYQENLRAKGAGLKIGNDREYANYLEYKVSVDKYAPGAILGEIKRKGLQFKTTISKTTFYRYIDAGVFLTITNKDLPVKRNKDKQKYDRVKPNRAPRSKSIEQRSDEIAARITFGHWEMDCVEGKKGTKKTLLVLTERKTRNEIIRLMKDKTTNSVIEAIDKIEAEYGADRFATIFKTITVDNGSEFADYEGIEININEKLKRTNLYYCHPYSPHERGSNENQNKMIRRHYPKGFDFSKVTAADIKKLEKWINEYPREIFGFCSSAELFEAHLNSIFAA